MRKVVAGLVLVFSLISAASAQTTIPEFQALRDLLEHNGMKGDPSDNTGQEVLELVS